MSRYFWLGAALGAACATGGYFLGREVMKREVHDELVGIEEKIYEELDAKFRSAYAEYLNTMTVPASVPARAEGERLIPEKPPLDKMVNYGAMFEAEPLVERSRYWKPEETPTADIPPERRNNIWEDDARPDSEVDFSYETEIRNRSEDAPYIVSVQEFEVNENDYEQVTVTWYEGDKVLVDQHEDPVEEFDDIIGTVNLRFGHRSGDNMIVYVNNDRTECIYEVLKHSGSYAETLGLGDG